MSDKKFPIFRRTGNGMQYYCVLSEQLAFSVTKGKLHCGVSVIENKMVIDDVINVYESDEEDSNKGCYHEITKKEFSLAFGEVADTIDKTANIMDEMIK